VGSASTPVGPVPSGLNTRTGLHNGTDARQLVLCYRTTFLHHSSLLISNNKLKETVIYQKLQLTSESLLELTSKARTQAINIL